MARTRYHSHVIARGAERWGLHLTGDDVRLLANKIMSGLGIEFERESKNIRKVFLMVGETEIPVVYNRRRGHIITILPPDAAEVLRATAKRVAR